MYVHSRVAFRCVRGNVTSQSRWSRCCPIFGRQKSGGKVPDVATFRINPLEEVLHIHLQIICEGHGQPRVAGGSLRQDGESTVQLPNSTLSPKDGDKMARQSDANLVSVQSTRYLPRAAVLALAADHSRGVMLGVRQCGTNPSAFERERARAHQIGGSDRVARAI